jgi:hypothetical protein
MTYTKKYNVTIVHNDESHHPECWKSIIVDTIPKYKKRYLRFLEKSGNDAEFAHFSSMVTTSISTSG